MKIRELRIKNNITQKELAEKLQISRSTYNNYEQKVAEPNNETLIKLADYFHTTVDNLLEHKVPYLLDKSTLTPEQKEIVEIIPNLNYEECKLLLAYLNGIKAGIEERNKKFN